MRLIYDPVKSRFRDLGATLLGIVLLPVDGTAGTALIVAHVVALGGRHDAVGAGFAAVLADFGFAGAQAGGFGAVEFAGAHALADAGALLALAAIDTGGGGLGFGGARAEEQQRRNNG